MPKPYKRVEVGSTVQFTWVGSASLLSINLAIYDQANTLISSGSGVSSGGGNYYRFVTVPESFASYPTTLLGKWTAVASTHAGNTSPFVFPILFDVIKTTPWG